MWKMCFSNITVHLKSPTECGTQTIQTSNDKTIDLEMRAALSTFVILRPIMQEWLSANAEDIIEISPGNWNPQEHHEEALANAPALVNVNSIESSPSGSELTMEHELALDKVVEAVIGESGKTWEEDCDVFHDTEEGPKEEETDDMPCLMERTPEVTSFESKVNEKLNGMTYHQLVGKSSTFDAMAFAIFTVEKL